MRVAAPVIGTVLILVACSRSGGPEMQRGEVLFVQHCAVCHGRDARGDGSLAGRLPVPPADLTGLAARNGGVFPWSDTMAKIHGYEGRAGVMPEFGTMLRGPTVIWRDGSGTPVKTPVGLLALARYLASIQM